MPISVTKKQANSSKPMNIGRYLVRDPRVCHGELTFRGTRVPVETVLLRLGKGRSVKSILESWPELTRAAIEEATTLAAGLLAFKLPSRSACP